VHRLLVSANVPISLILVTLMMEALRSPETWVLARTTWRNIPDKGILQKLKIISRGVTTYNDGFSTRNNGILTFLGTHNCDSVTEISKG
jgi:hypothetical protein